MKLNPCQTDRNHFDEPVSNHIWADVSQCEQLQTHRLVLSVRDVTLHDAGHSAPDHRKVPQYDEAVNRGLNVL